MRVQGRVGQRRLLAPLACSLLATWVWAPSAEGAVLTVTNTDDDGGGSLRAAIASANAAGNFDEIEFANGVTGTITLTTGQLQITSFMDIEGPGAHVLAVSGNGASRVLSVSAAGSGTVSGLTLTGGSVTASDGQDAAASGGGGGGGAGGGQGGDGGDGQDVAGDGASAGGAGVLNQGFLTLEGVAVTGNRVDGGGGGDASGTGGAGGDATSGGRGGQGGDGIAVGGDGGDALGGGIRNVGFLTLRESTVSGNVVKGGGGGEGAATGGDGGDADADPSVGGAGGDAVGIGGDGGQARGGGIYSEGAKLTVANVTVSGNEAEPGDAGNADASEGEPGAGPGGGPAGGALAKRGGGGKPSGGGIAVDEGFATLTSVTVARNRAGRGAGLAIATDVLARNSIFADPKGGGNCAGHLLSGGHNIDQGKSCGLDSGGDRRGVNAKLKPLGDNGGATLTHRPAGDSPAVDRGVGAGLATDQRGKARPFDFGSKPNGPGDGSDIGAVEVRPSDL